MNKDLIFKLYDFCKSNDSSTSIKDSDRYIRLIKDYIGEAEFIYAAHTYNEERAIDINNKFELVAIYLKSKMTCYIVDEFFFGIYRSDDFDDLINIRKWSGYVQHMAEYQQETVFPKFYESIEPVESNDYAESDLRNWARRKLLGDERWKKFIKVNVIEGSEISGNDCAKIVTGYYNADDVCVSALNRKHDGYIGMKTRQTAIDNYIANNCAATDNEIRLANVLNELDAQTITVEFTNNGKFAAEKIALDTVICKLINEDYFSTYDFPTRDKGKKILSALDASDSLWNDKKCLYASDITKITYRGKAIYEREG